ncbi:hypothetical protein [Paenibacillus thalictri]|uniref:hypothetical protein n=1 Tax=Paenibacillus thalictri TaxID=2527873 RepID=UPI0013EF00D3|nr:hypothetical protein [Paenibacillus thalictri]
MSGKSRFPYLSAPAPTGFLQLTHTLTIAALTSCDSDVNVNIKRCQSFSGNIAPKPSNPPKEKRTGTIEQQADRVPVLPLSVYVTAIIGQIREQRYTG